MKILSFLIAFSLLSPSAEALAEQGNDSVKNVIKESATSFTEDVVFKNLKGLVGGACNLQAMGRELYDIFFDEITPLRTLLEISLLIRNESWRELVWTLDDEIEAYQAKIRSVKKQLCMLEFGRGAAGSTGKEEEKRLIEKLISKRERDAIELDQILRFFQIQRNELLKLSQPQFVDMPETAVMPLAAFPKLSTERIFYFLFDDLVTLSAEQVGRDARAVIDRLDTSLTVISDQLPDACFAFINLSDEIRLHFQFALTEDLPYKNFKEFVEKNSSTLRKNYLDACEKAQKRSPIPQKKTSQDEEFEAFLSGINRILKISQKRLELVETRLLKIENNLAAKGGVPADKQEQFRKDRVDLLSTRGIIIGQIAYYTVVLSSVRDPSLESLKRLSESLSRFVEAILGVKKDKEGNASSRINLSDRFQKRKEQRLKDICSRLEAMYRASGRDTAFLPVIGVANGKTYCRSEPVCEEITNENVPGLSEGAKKLQDCSVLGFNASDLTPDPKSFKKIGEDIGFLLEQQAFEDLERSRALHFETKYNRYSALYQAQSNITSLISQELGDVKKNLFFEKDFRPFDPNNQTIVKNYSNVIRGAYKEFYTFLNKNKERCDVPEDI